MAIHCDLQCGTNVKYYVSITVNGKLIRERSKRGWFVWRSWFRVGDVW
jgi:hypothetical protein